MRPSFRRDQMFDAAWRKHRGLRRLKRLTLLGFKLDANKTIVGSQWWKLLKPRPSSGGQSVHPGATNAFQCRRQPGTDLVASTNRPGAACKIESWRGSHDQHISTFQPAHQGPNRLHSDHDVCVYVDARETIGGLIAKIHRVGLARDLSRNDSNPGAKRRATAAVSSLHPLQTTMMSSSPESAPSVIAFKVRAITKLSLWAGIITEII